MANSSWYPLSACLKQAQERQTAYATSEVHLFQADIGTINPSVTKTTLEANEANYDDYAAVMITAWTGPILAPGSGYEILSPAVLFEVGTVDPSVPNSIGGFWLEDSGGVVRLIGIFDPPLPMQVAGQGIPLNILDLFPTGFTG